MLIMAYTPSVEPINFENVNGIYDQLSSARIGTEEAPRLKELGDLKSTWRGRVIQLLRGLFGKEVKPEDNTSLLTRAFGEYGFEHEKGTDNQLFRAQQIDHIQKGIEDFKAEIGIEAKEDSELPFDFTKLQESLKSYHWTNPKESSAHLKALAKKLENLESASDMLCVKCAHGSEKTNEFVDYMTTHQNVFYTAKGIVKDTQKKLVEAEKVVSKLRKTDPKYVMQTDSRFKNAFKLFMEEQGVDTKQFDSENYDEGLLKKYYHDFVSSMAQTYFEANTDNDRLGIEVEIKGWLNQPEYRRPAAEQTRDRLNI